MSTNLEYHVTGLQITVHTPDKPNYIATCVVQKYFDVGIFSSAIGTQLFNSIYENRMSLFKETGIRYLEGYAMTNVANMLIKMCRNKWKLECKAGKEITRTGKQVIWIEVDLDNEEIVANE